jgi:hypothetical protein
VRLNTYRLRLIPPLAGSWLLLIAGGFYHKRLSIVNVRKNTNLKMPTSDLKTVRQPLSRPTGTKGQRQCPTARYPG